MSAKPSLTYAPAPAAEQRFLATVSHEIRTPLNGILGMASLLAETELSPSQADYVKAIRDSGARLLDLLNNVLDYARLDASGVELEESSVDIRSTCQDVIELLSPRAHSRNIDVATYANHNVPLAFRADEGRLRQILFNLVGNAIKFTEEGGVLLEVQVSRDHVNFHIRDTGPGLPEGSAATLFEAFEQSSASDASKDGGVGLGLAISHRLANAMGGKVFAVDRMGPGACFTLQLPLSEPVVKPVKLTESPRRVFLIGLSHPLELSISRGLVHGGHVPVLRPPEDVAPENIALVDARYPRSGLQALADKCPTIVLFRPEDREQIGAYREMGIAGYLIRPVRNASLLERIELCAQGQSTAAPSDDLPAPNGVSQTRVLICDDNPVNTMLASRTLEKSGYICTCAATGAEALDALDTSCYDLILMDLRMPVMDGFEAMKRIRARHDERANIPIIAISAEVNPAVERDALSAGANAVASKPLDAHTLRSIAERWTAKENCVTHSE